MWEAVDRRTEVLISLPQKWETLLEKITKARKG
jgi:hypothetical protein